MRALRLAALLALAAAPAAAQTAPPSGPSSGGVATAPRDPSTASAGLTAPNPGRTDKTVQDIDHRLLSQEHDRPHLPGQAASPSQGGTSTGAIPNSARPPNR